MIGDGLRVTSIPVGCDSYGRPIGSVLILFPPPFQIKVPLKRRHAPCEMRTAFIRARVRNFISLRLLFTPPYSNDPTVALRRFPGATKPQFVHYILHIQLMLRSTGATSPRNRSPAARPFSLSPALLTPPLYQNLLEKQGVSLKLFRNTPHPPRSPLPPPSPLPPFRPVKPLTPTLSPPIASLSPPPRQPPTLPSMKRESNSRI